MTGFPWNTGDELLAADLNAAFANSSEISGPPSDTTGWPFLPIAGGAAALAPFPKTPRIYRSDITPAKHLVQARAGYANAANSAGGAGLTFIVAGDSTGTEFANNALAPDDNIFGRIKSYMRRANPGIQFTMVDRSVAGSTWGALAAKPTSNFPPWYTDTTQDWVSYYVAPNATTGNVAPDIVFIPMGTNDGPAASTDVGIGYFASVFGFFANASMFPVQPDVVLVTNKGQSAAGGVGDVAGFQQVASIMRCIHYAGTSVLGVTGRTPGLIDLGRYDTMARYGYDPCVQHLVPTLSNVTGISAFPYTLPQCDGDFDLHVVWPGQGSTWANNGQSLIFNVGGTIATGTAAPFVLIGRNSTIFGAQYYGNANTLVITPPNVVIGSGDVSVQITCRQEQLRVAANGTVLYEGAVMRAGGRFTPQISIAGSPVVAPMTVVSYSAGACIKIEPSITDAETWGNGTGIDGNGVNHASSWGIAEMETLLLESTDFSLAPDAGTLGPFLPIIGGTLTGPLYVSSGYGFAYTTNRLNYVVPGAGTHVFTIAGTDIVTVNAQGLLVDAGFGLSLGSQVAGGNTDLSKHLALYGSQYGFCITGSRLNYNAGPGAAHIFVVNGIDSLSVGQNTVGFHGTAPIAKPTVTGSKGANAALASLLTALANYGLVTDSTT